jgi:hypothetical protein
MLIGDTPATLIDYDGFLSLLWPGDNVYFDLTARVSEQEMVKIAESVKFIE